jgi:hypothetical protein
MVESKPQYKRRFSVRLAPKSKAADVVEVIAIVQAKNHQEAVEKAKNVLKSPKRWLEL